MRYILNQVVLVATSQRAHCQPGSWQFVVTRFGISNSGYGSLSKTLPTITVTLSERLHQPPQPPVIEDPPIVNYNNPTCQAELDLGRPGSGGIKNMRIFGGGFLQDETVSIIEDNEVATSAIANTFGNYSVTLGFLHGLSSTPHTVHAHGETSGRTSNDAGFSV